MEPNELYHYGKLGMKWGKRKAQSSSGSAKKIKASSDAIVSARARQASRLQNIIDLDALTTRTTKSSDLSKVRKNLEKAIDDYNNNSDAEIAKKKTTGEKIVIGLSATSIVLTGIGLVAGKR